jgi:hypothetical protein
MTFDRYPYLKHSTAKPQVAHQETYKERVARQDKCKHLWHTVGQSHTGNVTGQRCEKCGKQEWF